MKIHIEKRTHKLWLDWTQMRNSYPSYFLTDRHFRKPLVGKYQYIVSNEKGKEISIIELPDYFVEGVTLWESCCLNCDFFDDIKRYSSFEAALEDVKKYLIEEWSDEERSRHVRQDKIYNSNNETYSPDCIK